VLTCNIYPREGERGPGDAPVGVLFTSDHAGDPKGVVRSIANVQAVTTSIRDTLDLTNKDRVLAAVPLYHAYGFDFGLAAPLAAGASLFLEDELSLKRILKMLRTQDANVLPGTPSLYDTLAREPTATALRTPRVRFLSGGTALHAATYEAFHKRYGVKILSCYHISEAGPIAVDRHGANPDTVGKPFEGVEVRVGSGAALEDGGIWVRSAAVTALTIGPSAGAVGQGVPIGGRDAQGWLRSGDLGSRDKAGRLRIRGREDDLVKLDGRRIALGEVEACIETFPKVSAAKVAVITDPIGGPMVVARVVARAGCGADEIIDHCARNLASHKVPRRIEFCRDLG
jgi:acyl-CoA synthetase (AMP-forming)/AMP-acid ligase II